MHNTAPLDGLIKQLSQTSRELSRAEGPVGVLAAIVEPPELDDEKSLEDLIDRLGQDMGRWTGLQGARASLESLVAPPALVDATPLTELVGEIESAQTHVATCEADLSATTKDLVEAEQALRRWAEINRVCPTCGTELDPERIVAIVASGVGGHPHG
jgi:NADH pyrophosphatase NudC (nudix superfamily)